MRWMVASLWIGGTVPSLGLTQEGAPWLVDEVVAVINQVPLTRSELLCESAVLAVQNRGSEALAEPALALDEVIDLRLLVDEAVRQGLPMISPEERRQTLELFSRRFETRERFVGFLSRTDMTFEDLVEILARHLLVDRMKERKLNSVALVADEEVDAYYHQNRLRFGGATLESLREAIRLKLLTQKKDKVLSKWLKDLRRRGRVKILVADPRDEK